jgi:hypothetical protein
MSANRLKSSFRAVAETARDFLAWARYGSAPQTVDDVQTVRLAPLEAHRQRGGGWDLFEKTPISAAFYIAAASPLGGVMLCVEEKQMMARNLDLQTVVELMEAVNPQAMASPGRDPLHPAHVRKLMAAACSQ